MKRDFQKREEIMQTQKIDFDEFKKVEKDIDSEFHKLDNTPLRKKGDERIRWWTRAVKNAVSKVLKERDREYKIRATRCDQADGKEWLYDLICLEYEDEYLKGIPLVLESEWKQGGVDADFQKLVVARADHRVMVFSVTSNKNKKEEKLINKSLQHVKKCRHSRDGDRYMFACWDEKKRKFHCSVYKVVKE